MSDNTRYLSLGIFDNLSAFDDSNLDKPIDDQLNNLKLTEDECSLRSRSYFDYGGIINGQLVKKMHHIKIFQDCDSQLQLERYLKRLVKNYKEVREEYYCKNEEDDGIPTNTLPDTDTLEDSFLDMMIDGEEFDSKNITKNDATADLLRENDDIDTFDELSLLHDKLVNSSLFVTHDSFYELSSSNIIQKINHGIIDSEVFQNTYNENMSDTIVIISRNHVLNILPFSILGNQITDSYFKNILLQYWKLPNFHNTEANNSWEIIKNNSDQSQFVLINKENGLLKFFKFITPLHFKLINNLNLTNTKIIDCVFLPNKSNISYNTIFLPVMRYDRLIYIVVEWDTDNLKNKIVHQLTILLDKNNNSNQAQSSLPLGCIPVGGNNIMLYSNKQLTLVSKNQILSGEINNFRFFNFRELRGIKKKNHFDAPLLLQKLHNIENLDIQEFDACTVMMTSTGNICFCLVNSKTNSVKFYLITKFKGLRSISKVNSVQNLAAHSNLYNLDIISFGRSLRLTLDLSLCIEINNIPGPRKNRRNTSLNAVVQKHTLDSSSEESSDILLVPSTTYANKNELWLTSSTGISKVSTDFDTVSRKSTLICKLNNFQVFNHFQFVDYSGFSTSLKSKIINNKGNDTQEDEYSYLLLATDLNSISKVFVLNLEENKDILTHETQLIEVEDILADTSTGTILFTAIGDTLIQVTLSAVYLIDVRSADDGYNLGLKRIFVSPFPISGASINKSNKLIIYDQLLENICYIEDILELDRRENFSQISGVFKFAGKITLDDFDIVTTSCRTETNIFYKFKWDDFVSLQTNSSLQAFDNIMNGLPEDHIIIASHKNFIYLRDFNNSKVIRHDVISKASQEVQMTFGGILFKTCVSHENMVIFYTTNRIQICEFYSTNNYRIYELKIPYVGKYVDIIEIKHDNKTDKMFVLFSDGLVVLTLTYFSYNISNFLLKSTRNIHKKFIYLHQFKRILVLNLDTNEWDFIKLSNGRILSLDNSVLKPNGGSDTEMEPSNIKLLNLYVLKIPFDSKYGTLILLIFENVIKLVSISPSIEKIRITCIDRYDFPSSINEKIIVKSDGYFHVYMKGISLHNQTSNKMDTFMTLRVKNNHIELMDKLEINSESAVTDFDISSDNIVFTTVKWDRVFVLHNYKKSIIDGKLYLTEIHQSSSSFVTKIKSITNDIFAISSRSEARSDYISQISLYAIGKHEGSVLPIHEVVVDGEERTIYQQLDDIQQISPSFTNDVDISIGMHIRNLNEVSNDTILGESSAESLAETTSDYNWKVPYQVMKFDKVLKNFNYDEDKKRLYILTADQSVMKYNMQTSERFHHNGEKLKEYELPNDSDSIFELPEITRAPLININQDGCMNINSKFHTDN